MAKFGKRRLREMGLLGPLERIKTKRVVPAQTLVPNPDGSRFNDLRFRPFLVIEAYTRPASNIRTEEKGWKSVKGSQKVSEIPSVVDRVTYREFRKAEVIIDIVNDCLVKNRLGNTTGIDSVTFGAEILTHFKEKYSDMVKRGKEVWEAQVAVDAAKKLMKAMRIT